MEASGLHEPTRKIKLPRITYHLEDLCRNDAVVIKVMGICEAEAVRFGKEQKRRLKAGENEWEVRHSLNTHVALADAFNNLTARQMEWVARKAYEAAGIGRPKIDFAD